LENKTPVGFRFIKSILIKTTRFFSGENYTEEHEATFLQALSYAAMGQQTLEGNFLYFAWLKPLTCSQHSSQEVNTPTLRPTATAYHPPFVAFGIQDTIWWHSQLMLQNKVKCGV
jgi:hypothetical protein